MDAFNAIMTTVHLQIDKQFNFLTYTVFKFIEILRHHKGNTFDAYI